MAKVIASGPAPIRPFRVRGADKTLRPLRFILDTGIRCDVTPSAKSVPGTSTVRMVLVYQWEPGVPTDEEKQALAEFMAETFGMLGTPAIEVQANDEEAAAVGEHFLSGRPAS